MIYTITPNPSLDYYLSFPQPLDTHHVNRAQRADFYPGGKGINVSILLGRLGQPTCALGFAGGFVGEELTRRMQQNHCQCAFLPLEHAVSRINVKVYADAELELNTPGPPLSSSDYTALLAQLEHLHAGDFLVLAGTTPQNAPADFYTTLAHHAKEKEALVIADTSGDAFSEVLVSKPFLVKPNLAELTAYVSSSLTTYPEILAAAKQVQSYGAKHVLVSLGAQGALLLCEDGQIFRGTAVQGHAQHTIGAGDSMVAGFLTGYAETGCLSEALRYGVAAGCATAFSDWLADAAAIRALISQVVISNYL